MTYISYLNIPRSVGRISGKGVLSMCTPNFDQTLHWNMRLLAQHTCLLNKSELAMDPFQRFLAKNTKPVDLSSRGGAEAVLCNCQL